MPIFSSFFTPDIPVNVDEPVNCSAIYELRAGKNNQTAASNKILFLRDTPKNGITAISDRIPTIQPFTANDRKGTIGSRTGVNNAPAIIETRPNNRKGRPPDHACLNKIPAG